MKKTILPLALLVLVVMVASACANTNTTNRGTTTPKSTSSTSNAVSWKPSLFPMELGNHWIYHYSFGDGKREELRVKHVVKTERGLRLDDADGECYYFVSDAQGWRINGETKLDDEHHTHYFKPAMVYASQELFSKGKLSGDHQVEDEGVVGENTIKSEATFEGVEEVELPRLGKLKAIHTT
ncbi:MAG: hypothetical protein KDB07_11700, partial [Planctomycetes bacterium]|nr:hypothetical protein [Planctomycetota bacterium]